MKPQIKNIATITIALKLVNYNHADNDVFSKQIKYLYSNDLLLFTKIKIN